MPEIVEKVESLATRKLGPLPVVAWIGIGVGGLVVFHLLTGGGSGASAASPSDVVPGGFDAGGIGGGGSTGGTGGAGDAGGTDTTPVPNPAPGSTPQTVKLSLTGATQLYSASGQKSETGASGTYIATKITLLGKQFYRFTRQGHTRLVLVNSPHIKVA